ncbi:MAG TPA: tetratricopeptide repeat protein, partial [Kiloniellaceae bacterium]|nr:tetratricopeptide repeat protein [Kiloniellaceae bacterium]
LAYIQSGQTDLAIAALNSALAKVPGDGFANLALISALALDGQEAAARETLERLLDHAASSPPALASLRKSTSWLGPGSERLISGLRIAGLSEQ